MNTALSINPLKDFPLKNQLCLTWSELCQCLTLSGSSVYRTEDRREDDRGRDRSPLRTEEHSDSDGDQSDTKKQKLAFGFGKKTTGNEQKKGIQIKLGSVSVSKTFALDLDALLSVTWKSFLSHCRIRNSSVSEVNCENNNGTKTDGSLGV